MASTVGRRGWPSPACPPSWRTMLEARFCCWFRVMPRMARAAIASAPIGLPVFRDDVPLDRREAERAGDAKNGGAARSVGCAEVADGDAEGVFEDGVAAGELLADAGGGLPGEPGVGHGVVADEVSGCGDGAGDLRALTDVAADEEEGGAYVVAGEDFEKALGDDVVGAVIVGEGDFVWDRGRR